MEGGTTDDGTAASDARYGCGHRRYQVPDAVVEAMTARACTEVALRGQDKAPAVQPGVTVEEMPRASIALTRRVPYRAGHRARR